MSFTNGAPGVTINEVDESFYINGRADFIPAFVGVTERGPVDTSTLITSWPEFQLTFGEYLASPYHLAYAVKAYFDSGGSKLYVVRITERTAGVTNAVTATKTLQTVGGGATKARETGNVAGRTYGGVLTWQMVSGNKLSFSVDGAAKVTVTISATAASEDLSNVATFTLANGQTIKYRVGGATEPERTVTLSNAGADFVDITNATPAEVQAVLARDMVGVNITRVVNQVTITTDQKGTGAYLEFTSGTALAGLGIAVAANTGAGNVVDVDHVTVTEMNTLANAADSGVTFGSSGSNAYLERDTAGVTKTIQVKTDDGNETAGAAVFGFSTTLRAGTSNTPIDTLTIDALTPGTWGNDLTVDTAAATVNASTRGKLTVKYLGSVVETYDEYSLDPADDRYILKLTEGSSFIAVTDEDAYATLSSYVTALPAVASASALTTGTDAISGLVAADYSGSQTYLTGLYALDATTDIRTVAAPGYTDRTYAASEIAYCEARKNLMAILDAPDNVTATVAKDYRYATGAYAGGSSFDTSYAALYHNWPKVVDPSTKTDRYIPPSGVVAGRIAAVGKWKAPAGPTNGKATGVTGLRTPNLGDVSVGDLYSNGVNALVSDTTFGIIIKGQKTLQAVPSDYSEVKIRLGGVYIRTALAPTIARVAEMEPNDATTWTRLKRAIEPFADEIVRDRGITAYRIVCDATTNTAAVIAQRRLVCKFFVKYTPTAEFVEVDLTNVSQSTDLG